MHERRELLLHFLATLDYRTSKALDGAPAGFGDFQAGEGVRTPAELVAHMSSLLSYTLVSFGGAAGDPPGRSAGFHAEIARFQQLLRRLASTLAASPL